MMEEKLYYRIKDICEFVGESASTLRYWESEFDILKPQRGGKGRRLYTTTDIDNIRKIQFLLRNKGLHINAAKEQLKNNYKNVSTRTEAIEELTKIKEELELMLKSLSKRF